MRDEWAVNGAVVSVRRNVTVTGRAPSGFASSLVFALDPAVGWQDVQYLAPGALYGDPTYDGDRSPGGTLNYAARRFVMREDMLPAPLFALSFSNGASVAVLDPSPRGDTTVEETKLSKAVMTDARFQFGALGALAGGRRPHRVRFLVSRHDDAATAAVRGEPPRPQMDAALSPDRAGRGAQLRGEFSLRAERIVPRRDAQRVALGLEHAEARRHLH